MKSRKARLDSVCRISALAESKAELVANCFKERLNAMTTDDQAGLEATIESQDQVSMSLMKKPKPKVKALYLAPCALDGEVSKSAKNGKNVLKRNTTSKLKCSCQIVRFLTMISSSKECVLNGGRLST